MNDVRRRALKRAAISVILMAPVWYYLWLVDYRNAPFPDGYNVLAVGFITPCLGTFVVACVHFYLGRVLGPGAPKILRE